MSRRRRGAGKTSDDLALEAQMMQDQLRQVRMVVAQRSAQNPNPVDPPPTDAPIWGSNRSRQQRSHRGRGSTGRRRRPARSRRKVVSAESRRRANPQAAPPSKRSARARHLDGIPSRAVPPPGVYSHHFSTVFDKTEVIDDPSTSSTSSTPSLPSRTLPDAAPQVRPIRGRGRTRGRDRRRKRLPRPIPRRKTHSSSGMTDLARETFRENLLDTYNTKALVPDKYQMNTLEGVIRKRKVEKAQSQPSSLILEVFDEWRRLEIAGSETVDSLNQSISASKALPADSANSPLDQPSSPLVDEIELAPPIPVHDPLPSAPSPYVPLVSSGGVGTDDVDVDDTGDDRGLSSMVVSSGGIGTSTGMVSSGGVGTDDDHVEPVGGSLLDGDYDPDAGHASFTEALMEWRREQGLIPSDAETETPDPSPSSSSGTVTTSTATASVSSGTTTTTTSGFDVGRYDPEEEAKQHKMFQEAVMEWRQQQDPHPVDRLDLFSGTFSMPSSTATTTASVQQTSQQQSDSSEDGGVGVGGMEVFVENLKSCLSVSYFDSIEGTLEELRREGRLN